MCEARLATEEQLSFAISCIEAIASLLHKDSRDVYDALAVRTDLLDSYIARHYDVLHTQDRLYVAEEVIRELESEGGEHMILYHGSPAIVSRPDTIHSRTRVDFGRGFYTTPLREQAISWCERFKRRGSAYLNVYELDEASLDRYSLPRFDSYSEEWLDFVLACRRGLDDSDYDMVIGGVANDKVFDTIELFVSGLIGKDEALGRLRFERPNVQLCIRSQPVIDECLTYVRSERQ